MNALYYRNSSNDEELIGVLTAISVVSKRLARNLIRLSQTSQSERRKKYVKNEQTCAAHR